MYEVALNIGSVRAGNCFIGYQDPYREDLVGLYTNVIARPLRRMV